MLFQDDDFGAVIDALELFLRGTAGEYPYGALVEMHAACIVSPWAKTAESGSWLDRKIQLFTDAVKCARADCPNVELQRFFAELRGFVGGYPRDKQARCLLELFESSFERVTG